MENIIKSIEEYLAQASANIKLVDQALTGMQGSYVELLTVLAIALLGVIPVIVPQKRRQVYRHLTQLFGIFIFIFVVYTCLGVFGMIRNFHRGLLEIGRENIIALYFCSVPVTILTVSMIFGPMFCGWICPTGAVQEFSSAIFGRWQRQRKREGYPFKKWMLVLSCVVISVFFAWVAYLGATRVFFVEDSSLYWSEILIILLLILMWRMREWDYKLRRLRILSFGIIAFAAVAGWRILSPVHFTFNKVYDPASMLTTIMVALTALAIPHIWCRYLCPWREAIAWAGKHSVRKLEKDEHSCVQCGTCNMSCKLDAVEYGDIDQRECHMCLRCVDHCPNGALKVVEKWKSEE